MDEIFLAKTNRIKRLSKDEEGALRIAELKGIFDRPTNVYIDFANVIPWQSKLGWHIDIENLKQFLDSFKTIKEVKFYNGTLEHDSASDRIISTAERCGYIVITKPVKIMKLSIDISSISMSSPEILKTFIRSPLLTKLDIKTIEYLNERLRELNKQGIVHLEDRKCNFDVEIGRHMLGDYDKKKADNFMLWSGDSDFAGPIRQLLDDGKKVVIFATARKVSRELNDLRTLGLLIFDIQKIRNFICYKREMKAYKKQKGLNKN